jgi:hypothetical protein
VPGQGILFQCFLEICASRRKYHGYVQACKAAGQGNAVDQAFADGLVAEVKYRFYGWLLSALANIGVPGKEQLWYITSVVKFLGLSRLGQEVMQQFGFASTVRYSDGKHANALTYYDTTIR